MFSLALATEARADLNLSSSTTVQCVGGEYALNSCEVLRFTLQIPDPQVPTNATSPAVNGQVYSDFGVSQFSLESFLGAWAYMSLLNASPGTWAANLETNSFVVYGSQANSTGTGDFPPPPITFDIRMSAYESDLANLQMQYSANGFGTGPNVLGAPDAVHAWSAGGLVSSTVPEPATMILLGSGLMGLAGIGRRRRRHDVENA
jgi:hypothetical protein